MKSRILLAAALVLALSSCAKRSPTAPVVLAPPGPSATTAAGVVERLMWAMQARDVPAYTALLTDDFVFQFAANDSAGNPFPARCMDRALEEAAMQHMLVGGSSRAAVADIKLTIADRLVALPDPRPGMNSRWHKCVRTPVDLKLTWNEGGSWDVTSISGYALFYVVRGDSAFFLPARASARDSTRWFISRWEDETAGASGSPGLHANPTRTATLGSVKVLYIAPISPTGTR